MEIVGCVVSIGIIGLHICVASLPDVPNISALPFSGFAGGIIHHHGCATPEPRPHGYNEYHSDSNEEEKWDQGGAIIHIRDSQMIGWKGVEKAINMWGNVVPIKWGLFREHWRTHQTSQYPYTKFRGGKIWEKNIQKHNLLHNKYLIPMLIVLCGGGGYSLK